MRTRDQQFNIFLFICEMPAYQTPRDIRELAQYIELCISIASCYFCYYYHRTINQTLNNNSDTTTTTTYRLWVVLVVCCRYRRPCPVAGFAWAPSQSWLPFLRTNNCSPFLRRCLGHPGHPDYLPSCSTQPSSVPHAADEIIIHGGSQLRPERGHTRPLVDQTCSHVWECNAPCELHVRLACGNTPSKLFSLPRRCHYACLLWCFRHSCMYNFTSRLQHKLSFHHR